MKKLLNFFKRGYDIRKINNEINNVSIDTLIKNKKKSIIFDVGGSRGQSIEKYKKIFKNQLFTL